MLCEAGNGLQRDRREIVTNRATAPAPRVHSDAESSISRRQTGSERPATRQQQPTRNNARRQGHRHDHSIAAGQKLAMLAFTRQKSQVRSLSRHQPKRFRISLFRVVCQKICQKSTVWHRRSVGVARSEPPPCQHSVKAWLPPRRMCRSCLLEHPGPTWVGLADLLSHVESDHQPVWSAWTTRAAISGVVWR
jgi:hypothetical protein